VIEHSKTQRSVAILGGELADLKLETEYRTSDSDPAAEFYNPCLLRASTYDRAVGYFRSSVFAVSGRGILDLAQRGGRIRLVCSPEITPEDWEAIERGHQDREHVIAAALSREMDRLSESLETRRHTETLATLIRLGILELQIAIRSPSHGMFHEKLGIFGDHRGNGVSFKGSSNETWNGWHEWVNLESIEVFCSWRDDNERNRVERHRTYFERLWSGNVRGLEVVAIPEAFRLRLDSLARSDLGNESQPHSNTRTPLPHQEDALSAWHDAGRRGVLKHATGSGKTFTALLALREHLAAGSPAVVVVPSTLLLDQWMAEINETIPEATVLAVGAGNNTWRKRGRLESFTSSAPSLGPRIVLSTMQTASKEEFRRRLRTGPHLMVVADEVHQIGSRENARVLEVESGPRLGLSATPERYGDFEGTRRIFEYFGPIIDPVVTLEDAIKAGRLVEYQYFPHPVNLTADETERWQKFSEQISREVARSEKDSSGHIVISERAKLLLIQRSRIAKKARGKIALAVATLSKHFREGDSWLVYCEDIDQLHEILSELRRANLQASEYYSGMPGDPKATLDWLRQFGGIVVSVRCLDEGVDIPSVSHALILASSQNPRQFIQRRGRVLRRSPSKQFAVVHDAIVVPPHVHAEPEQAALARSEMSRAIEFARSAVNRGADAELRDIAAEIGLDLTLEPVGVEEPGETLPIDTSRNGLQE
jgi:superfamily II DNA or RNA helicase